MGCESAVYILTQSFKAADNAFNSTCPPHSDDFSTLSQYCVYCSKLSDNNQQL